jgi:hypothetical protein
MAVSLIEGTAITVPIGGQLQLHTRSCHGLFVDRSDLPTSLETQCGGAQPLRKTRFNQSGDAIDPSEANLVAFRIGRLGNDRMILIDLIGGKDSQRRIPHGIVTDLGQCHF